MYNKTEKFNSAIAEAEFYASKESRFTAEELLNEIKPLIEETFIGKFSVKGNKMIMRFLNGQIFVLKAAGNR